MSVTFRHEAHLGETPNIKTTGCLSEILEKTPPPKGTKIPFCGCGLKVFSPPKRYITNNNTLTKALLLYIFFLAQHTIRNQKSSCCGPHEAEHPNRFKTSFLTPKSTLILFIWESHSAGGIPLFKSQSLNPYLQFD